MGKLLLLALSLLPGAARADGPLATLHLDRGFIDDPMALSDDGQTLYYVATDGATFAELRAAQIGKGEVKTTLVLPGLKLSTVGLWRLPDDRLLVVERDPATERESGVVYSVKARAQTRERIGPATALTLAEVGGAPVVVAFSKPGDKGGDFRVQAVHAGTWRPLGQRSFHAPPLYLTDGYLTLVTKQIGEFDKKNDVRRNDSLAFLDALSGKVQRTEPIAEPVPLAELVQLRERHPGAAIFVAHDAGAGKLELVAGQARRPLQMPRPLSVYDPATLRTQQLTPGRLLLSLTVDPVNEAAVKRQKRDADTIDLCTVDVQSGQVQRLLELPGGGRPSTWTAAKTGRLALLRKHRGFSRGGTDVEIYDLSLPVDQEARR